MIAGSVAEGISFMGESINKAKEAATAQAQLEAVLKSTGGVAGMTAESINALAEAAGNSTKFADDQVVAGENMLLTFTNIGKDTFPIATSAMLDLSQAMGQDMKSSAVQLGKALNDPEKGITALTRVGVTFTEQQKEQIKAMQDSGDMAGAQAVILNELNREFGGSAAAAEKAAGGADILNHQFERIQEKIGGALLPGIATLGGMLSTYLASPEVQAGITNIANGIAAFAQTVIANIPQVIAWFRQVFDYLQNNQGIVVAIFAVMGVAVVTFGVTSAIALWAAVSPLLPIIAILALVGAAIYLLYQAWQSDWGGIREATAGVWAWIQTAFANVVAWLTVNIPVAIQVLITWWNNLVIIVTNVWNMIKGVVGDAFAVIQDRLAIFQDIFSGNWHKLGEDIRKSFEDSWKLLVDALGLAWEAIKTVVSVGVQNVITFFTKTDWGSVGTSIIQGIANGITAGIHWITDAAKNAAQAALDIAKGLLGINSPSSVFAEVGSNMMVGWAQGISGSAHLPAMATMNAASSTVSSVTNINVAPHYYKGDEPSMGEEVNMLMMQYAVRR